MREVVIITGASHGLGQELALRMLAPGVTMLSLQRHSSTAISDKARQVKARLLQLSVDLNKPEDAASALECWLATTHLESASRITLVCCAAKLGSVGPADKTGDEEFLSTMRVNAIAPMLIVRRLLGIAGNLSAEKRIVCISSQAGRRPVAGLSAYCASKAALDRFCETVAAEESSKPNGAKIVSLAPAPMDSDSGIRTDARRYSVERLPSNDEIHLLLQHAKFSSPTEAAEAVLEFMNRPNFGKRAIADTRD